MDFKRVFRPPTIEQLEKFIDEYGLEVDAEQFFFYYAARGWYMSAGVMMCDWRAAVYSWHIQKTNWNAQAADDSP